MLRNVKKHSSERFCSSCGHSENVHTEALITKGYGEGGRCGFWHDRMFGGTDECNCDGFKVSALVSPAAERSATAKRSRVGDSHPKNCGSFRKSRVVAPPSCRQSSNTVHLARLLAGRTQAAGYDGLVFGLGTR